MLRRPITVLSITAEDVADFEDRRAERLEARHAMRRSAAAPSGVLRDPRLQRITQGAQPGPPARGHAAGWEYDSAEEDEAFGFEEQEYDDDDDNDNDEQDEQDIPQLRRTILPPRGQPMLHHQQAGLRGSAGSHPANDGRMDIDTAPRRENMRAASVTAGAPVTPGAAGGAEQSVNPSTRAAPSSSDPPGGDARARIRVGRPRPTREERIGVAPPAPERRRRPHGPGQQPGGA